MGGGDMLLQHSKSLSYTKKYAVIRPGFSRLSIAGCATLLGYCSTILIVRSSGPEIYGSYALVVWLASVATPDIQAATKTMVPALAGTPVGNTHRHDGYRRLVAKHRRPAFPLPASARTQADVRQRRHCRIHTTA